MNPLSKVRHHLTYIARQGKVADDYGLTQARVHLAWCGEEAERGLAELDRLERLDYCRRDGETTDLLKALTSQASSHLEVTRLRAVIQEAIDTVASCGDGTCPYQLSHGLEAALQPNPDEPLTLEAPISPVFEEHARFKAALREIAEHDPEIKGGAAAHEAYWNQSEIARKALETPTS